MPMMALQFLGSKLGAWVIVGILALALGATWKVQQWRIEAVQGKLAGVTAERDQAISANERFEAKILEITNSAEAQKARADKAVADLAASKARNDLRITNILREVQNASSAADRDPLSPAERAALIGLRDAYPDR